MVTDLHIQNNILIFFPIFLKLLLTLGLPANLVTLLITRMTDDSQKGRTKSQNRIRFIKLKKYLVHSLIKTTPPSYTRLYE